MLGRRRSHQTASASQGAGPVVSRVAIVTFSARFDKLPRERRWRELLRVDTAAAIAQLVARWSHNPNIANSIFAHRVRLEDLGGQRIAVALALLRLLGLLGLLRAASTVETV